MSAQRKLVQSFFDQLASSYRQRYEGAQPFLKYLHEERVEMALKGLDLSGKKILDIGAGAGILYEHLLRIQKGFDYYACDISEAMLRQSQIPKDRQWVGTPQECAFPQAKFDYIYLLGVTTYLSESEFEDILNWISAHLLPGGVAVLSFSNSESWSFRIRKMIAPLLPKRRLKRTVLGQAFSFQGYSVDSLQKKLQKGLRQDSITWMNATFFPFNRLFPSLSVWLSQKILRRQPPEWIARRICGDYLIFICAQ